MTPINTFIEVSQLLTKKPFEFWPVAKQQKILSNLSSAISKLKKLLETKDLVKTHAYIQLVEIEKTITQTSLKEVQFVQHLIGLVDIYKHSPANPETTELIQTLEISTGRAKAKILSHHLLLEHLGQRAKKLTVAEQQKMDLVTIQKVGFFYVLEYTLQVLFEFSTLLESDKVKLLKEGLKTKAGKLPAYFPLEDVFRKELCYAIFDKQLRMELLTLFFNFEEVLYGDDLVKTSKALKQFNISVLQAFEKKGVELFKGIIYTPFGNNIAINEVVEKIYSCKI